MNKENQPEASEKSKNLNGFQNLIRQEISELSPSYFALVMATGIVSNAAWLMGMKGVAEVLFYINIAAYIILWQLFISRLIFYFDKFYQDISNHAKSPGFLTLVAGSCVLGNQFVLLQNNLPIAAVLYFLGFFLWLILIYSFFVMITIKGSKPTLNRGINGIWLLTVVSTQSISVLGVSLSEYLPVSPEVVLFLSLILFLLGCILYIIIITLIFYRLTFFEVKAKELAPPYWINMGAVAITTLAGAELMLNSGKWELLNSLGLFIKGMTLWFWAIGTWWIPIILILGIWRHIYKKIPLTYHPQYWGLVFPLGMYTVCTYQLAKSDYLDFLFAVPELFIYPALAAWVITFFGLISNVFSKLRKIHS